MCKMINLKLKNSALVPIGCKLGFLQKKIISEISVWRMLTFLWDATCRLMQGIISTTKKKITPNKGLCQKDFLDMRLEVENDIRLGLFL